MKPQSRRFFILALVLAVGLWQGCEEEYELVRHFTIPKGEHYANPRVVESLQSDRLVFEAVFDQSAMYNFDDKSMQSNKNKLMGFSDCNNQHHENSARFVWQWFNNRLEIFAYCYVNSERVEEFIGTVELNQKNRYEIELTDSHYIFKLNDQEAVHIERGDTCNSGVYYKLWPYFGGSLPAPHDVHIAITSVY